MISDINRRITDFSALRNGYIVRDGFYFAKTAHDPIFDSLIIRHPHNAVGSPFRSPASERTIEEHIQLVNRYQIEKAVIICNDLSFITRCPSLRSIAVYPSVEAKAGFDFSPLYEMPNIQELHCMTVYGYKDQFHSEVNYSQLPGIRSVSASGVGHVGYEFAPLLENLWLSGNKRHSDFTTISCSPVLKNVTIIQCGINALHGLEKHPQMQKLALFHCRSLSDITALRHISKTIRSLTIENCPKITDFSVLMDLCELEHLHLYGSNTLPNLDFLQRMNKLKTFCFTMTVDDGDLTACKNVPYVSCKNKKHYNMKDKDLPKQLPANNMFTE